MVKCCVLFEVRTGFLSIKPPVVDAADLFSKLPIKQSETQNSKFRCLSEATPYHHNVFTFTLLLLEGRAGVAWEPSNKMMVFLPLGK
jgi:hypothetical protein